MTKFFDDIEDFIPAFSLWMLWLLVFPFRVLILLVLPMGSRRGYHRLSKVHDFFAFEGR